MQKEISTNWIFGKRRLKAWTRSTMTNVRLNGLALMQKFVEIHRNYISEDSNEIRYLLDSTGHRQIALGSIRRKLKNMY